MQNLLEFEGFPKPLPGQNQSTVTAAEPNLNFGNIDFTMSGVSDDAMKVIAGLMAQTVLASGEAERIARMADNDPTGAASYLQKKVEGILTDIPGVNPSFIQAMKSQSANLSKSMVQAIPGLLGSLTDKDIEANELKPDTNKSSLLNRLSTFFADNTAQQ